MKPVFIGNNAVSINELIGKGGEGEVYSVKGSTALAVKIYNANLRAKREDKVRAMIGEKLASRTDLVAYPGGIVTDQNGSFLGFVMRLVTGYRPLHELYSPKSRQRHFPKADYRFMVHAARNVARAVGNVHQTSCVIGDLNHSGVLVAQDSTVALIDADSFQFNIKGRSYACVVGVPDFTPPELHGVDFRSLRRTVDHDNFGLAVAIFHLLFMGRHPYAGRSTGPDITMSDAIAQNRFAYSLTRRGTTNAKPPPGTLSLDVFPKTVTESFEAAFGLMPKERPSAREWIDALGKLEGSLNRCSKVKTHYFPANSKNCVWCKQFGNSGFDMFPDLNAETPRFSTHKRATEQAIREIEAIRFPAVADLLPMVAAPKNSGDSLRQAKSSRAVSRVWGIGLIGAAIAGLVGALDIWFVWAGMGIWGGYTIFNSEIDAGPFLREFKTADQKVQQELSNFLRSNGLSEILKVRSNLFDAISSYKGHDQALAQQIKNMKSNRKARQKQAYLDGFPIRRANISGIGPANTTTLISFGIETAADVNRSAILRVPGFGDKKTRKLIEWKNRKEANFKYNPNANSQDVADEKALRGRFGAEKVKLEATIGGGLKTLRNARGTLSALPAKARNDKALLGALFERAQVEKDLKELGIPVPASDVALTLPWETKPTPKQSRPVAYSAPKPTYSAPKPKSKQTNPSTPSCPSCGSSMRRRSGRYGRFWGCSNYPRCKGTRNI